MSLGCMSLGRHALPPPEIGGGHDSGNDGDGDARPRGVVTETRGGVIVKTEL